MSDRDFPPVPRRAFLKLGAAALTGGGFAGFLTVPPLAPRWNSQRDVMTPDEEKRVEASAMARDLKNYFGEGYSCAESILMVSLHAMGEEEKLVWAAGGFGGGMGQKDLCGFLTGALIALGFAAGRHSRDRDEAKAWNSRMSQAFWSWWRSEAPLHCSEIRPPGSDPARCRRLGLLAAVRLEEQLTGEDRPSGSREIGDTSCR